MPKRTGTDHELLTMALVGAEAEIARLDKMIAELRAKMGKRGPGRPKAATGGTAPRKRHLSAAARRRIAAAQRKRWAAVKKQLTKATPKKRKLSVAARHKMAVAARKRWAAQRKAAAKKAKPAMKGTKKPAAVAAFVKGHRTFADA